MSFGYLNNLNTTPYMYSNPNFRAQSVSVQNLEDSIEKLANRVEEEKKKKHNKTAMAVGGSVLGLSLFVAILNPRSSSKLMEKLKKLRLNSWKKAERAGGGSASGKFHKTVSKTAKWLTDFVSWTNNVNSVKDTYYKKLCTEEKSFHGIHNIETRKSFQKFDKVFRKLMKGQHETLTKWGDMLAKRTVRNGYKTAGRKMDKLEALIRQYSEKLPADKKQIVEEKLREIHAKRNYFTEGNLNQRFINQENLLENINADIRKKWSDYAHGFLDKNVKSTEHFNQNLSFWAEDIVKPERDKLEAEGLKVVDSIVGNKNGTKGQYQEILEFISNSLSAEENKALEKAFRKTEKSLHNAGHQEYGKYFNKKRDLMLGSAPTDIVTAVVGLSMGGIALATADNKDDRISRLITGIIPTVAGIGTNIALTSMLFSGVKGMLLGVGTGGILSLVGSGIDKYRLSSKQSENNNDNTAAKKGVNLIA